MAGKKKYSGVRRFFAFVFVFGLLLIGLVMFSDIGPIKVLVVAAVSVLVTAWLVRPVRHDGPPGSEPPDHSTYQRR